MVVVTHLVSDAELGAELEQRCLFGGGEIGGDGAGADGEFEEGDGFERGEAGAVCVAGFVGEGEIEGLAAD